MVRDCNSAMRLRREGGRSQPAQDVGGQQRSGKKHTLQLCWLINQAVPTLQQQQQQHADSMAAAVLLAV